MTKPTASVISTDGVRIGLLTAGSRPALLLVHGGMGTITRELVTALPAASVTELPGAGHEALDSAPDLLVAEVLRFIGNEASCN